jgi:ribonucleotide reductase beta subunit family protein with ferritin-like domain
VYNHFMEGLLLYAGFLIVWFFVLPRIPGISRFT